MLNCDHLLKDIGEILLPEQLIRRRVGELARQITQDYEGLEPMMIGILNGASVFYIDLIMEMSIMAEMHFMAVSSYHDGSVSSGNIRIDYDLREDIKGRDVLIVEDIVDSGRTLKCLKELLWARNPKSIKVCTLLDKPDRREVDMEADYVGFTVPDQFLVGYGLDYAQKYRNLRYIAVLKPEAYTK